MHEHRRSVLAVIGSGSALDPELEQCCVALGRQAVESGWRIVTGGLGGVMAAVSRGARQAANWRDGDVIGIVPGYDRFSANPWVDVVVPTGMQMGRNILVVAMADVVLAVSGGAGTLSEIALAWQLDKPLLALRPTGGWAAALSGTCVDDRQAQPIRGADSVEEALAAAREMCDQRGPEPGDIGSGWRKRSS